MWHCSRAISTPLTSQWLDEAWQLGMQLRDPVVCAYVQGFQGTSALFRGQFEEAVFRYEGAVAAHKVAGEEPAALLWLFQLSIAQAQHGDSRAAETGRNAVALAEVHWERLCRSYILTALGFEAWARGDCATSMVLTRTALEIMRGFNDYLGTLMQLNRVRIL